jgi:hypothetical protein
VGAAERQIAEFSLEPRAGARRQGPAGGRHAGDALETGEALGAGVLDPDIGFRLDDAPHVEPTRLEALRDLAEVSEPDRTAEDVARHDDSMCLQRRDAALLLVAAERRRATDGRLVPSI